MIKIVRLRFQVDITRKSKDVRIWRDEIIKQKRNSLKIAQNDIF